MLIHVYETSTHVTRSVLLARHVAAVEVEAFPDEPQDFADEHDGDYLEVVPGEEDDHE